LKITWRSRYYNDKLANAVSEIIMQAPAISVQISWEIVHIMVKYNKLHTLIAYSQINVFYEPTLIMGEGRKV
jgi:hypothetical protein